MLANVEYATEQESEWNATLGEMSKEALRNAFSLSGGSCSTRMARYGFPADWRMLLTPGFMTTTGYGELESALCAVVAAIDFMSRDDGSPEFGHSAESVRFVRRIARDQDWCRIARADLVLSDDGFRLVELNVGPNVGGVPIVDVVAATMEEFEPFRRFLEAASVSRRAVTAELAAHMRLTDGVGAGSSVGIGYWRNQQFNMPEHFLTSFAGELSRNGLDTCVAALEDLQFADRISVPGRGPIDLLYRFFWETKGADPEPLRILRQLIDAEDRGRIRIVGNFTGSLAAGKLDVAQVSEAADHGLLPRTLADRVRSIVPWSRVLADRPVLYESREYSSVQRLAASRRGDFVVKHAFGFAGSDVVFGRESTKDDWELVLARALREPNSWVIQQVVEPRQNECYTSSNGEVLASLGRSQYGAYLFGRRLSGLIRRFSDRDGLNISVNKDVAQGAVYVVPD